MGSCLSHLKKEMVAPPPRHRGDPFRPEYPMAQAPRSRQEHITVMRPRYRSSSPPLPSPPLQPHLQHPPSVFVPASMSHEPRKESSGSSTLVEPMFGGQVHRGSRGSGDSALRSISTSGSGFLSPRGSPRARQGRSASFSLSIGSGGLVRVETPTHIPGLTFDQAGRPVWRDPQLEGRC
jgi:hypothetical protein